MRRRMASVGGLGFLPRRIWGNDKGAGTVGAAVAWGISYLLWPAPWAAHAAVGAVAIALALWSAQPFADGDPGWICIDEVAGTLVAVIGLSGWPWLVAIVVARGADIFKVLPGIRRAEALPGTLGVTMDDVLAGGYGLAAGWLAAAFLG